MGTKDRIKQAASDLAHDVKDATDDMRQRARLAVAGLVPDEQGDQEKSPPSSGADGTTGGLREIHPDPANKAGVRDTAGDRVDHQ